MLLQNKLFSNKFNIKELLTPINILIVVFFVIHILIININYAEWGDSYRILRAAEFLKHFTYPQDEKRQPLFSMILSLRPYFIDPVFWARVVVFFISSLSLVYFIKLMNLLKLRLNEQILGLILFILNPVFLYWSIRVMTDILLPF